MEVFRLVNDQHDPTRVGEILVRTSDHSHQKLGNGMYFAASREDALQFARTQREHEYTHLLGCRLKGVTRNDFVDLVEDPNCIIRSEFASLPGTQRGLAYCKRHGKKGLIWRATKGWTEICLFSEFSQNTAFIESVEKLVAFKGAQMFSTDADIFFLSPRTKIGVPNWFGVLYLLRRDIDLCMGIDPDTGLAVSYRAEWPGAMAILAGIDLLAKFFAGSDERGKVGERFSDFLKEFFVGTSEIDRNVIYQLRNSLLHSFGLYSKDKNTTYRFFLTGDKSRPLVAHRPPDQYWVDLRALHGEFEKAVAVYELALDADQKLQVKFAAMFGNYGKIHIG